MNAFFEDAYIVNYIINKTQEKTELPLIDVYETYLKTIDNAPCRIIDTFEFFMGAKEILNESFERICDVYTGLASCGFRGDEALEVLVTYCALNNYKNQ